MIWALKINIAWHRHCINFGNPYLGGPFFELISNLLFISIISIKISRGIKRGLFTKRAPGTTITLSAPAATGLLAKI
jgi:hypothetical protein